MYFMCPKNQYVKGQVVMDHCMRRSRIFYYLQYFMELIYTFRNKSFVVHDHVSQAKKFGERAVFSFILVWHK